VHAPAHYKCVQTLVNKQRFVTLQLLSLAHEVTSAQTAADEREKQLYQELLVRITEQIPALRAYAHTLATLDAWYGLAQAALAHGYVRPVMHTQSDIQITKGRHAVIEALQRSRFIPNDVSLTDREKLWLITGPNMAGKSTFLRQIALICIMAQAGSFVPAEAASLPVLDKLFTRIGASDNVAGGKSTFFVEMEEVATICAQATPQSLVILDEVGRGTSAQEGLVIAQALVEYLYDTIQARTLFATHYHELARLVHDRPAIACYQAASAEKGDSVIFFHTIIPGVAHSSRGIETAALAGVPSSVLKRAQQLLLEYGQQDHVNGLKRVVQQAVVVCTDCPQSREVIEQLKSIELDDMTPRQAYDLVAQLQRKSKSL
jgi:DNA mismatch repair protein MutS